MTRAVAESWFKLLTYKDEYEVARLHLKVDYDEVARELGIDGPYSVAYHLHPPFLRRLGMRKKLVLGTSYAVGVPRPPPDATPSRHALRRLRLGPGPAYGASPGARVPPGWWRQSLADASLSYDDRVAVAESALAVKGYAQVKEQSVQRWRDAVARPSRGVACAYTCGDA